MIPRCIIFASLLCLGFISAISPFLLDKTTEYVYAQGTGWLNSSNKIVCNGSAVANSSVWNISQGVNNTNATLSSVPTSANMSTGLGELAGISKPVKPSQNLSLQNQEPENLVPNLKAFEKSKQEANSPCPPGNLLKSLENKNLVQP